MNMFGPMGVDGEIEARIRLDERSTVLRNLREFAERNRLLGLFTREEERLVLEHIEAVYP